MSENMKDKLYQKYIVTRTDGKSTDGQTFFVLRLDVSGFKGKAARHAARTYARFIEKELPELSEELYKQCDQFGIREIENI
jgi:hypothetical protein